MDGVEVEPIYHVMDDISVAQINAPAAWAAGYTGSGVTVAVIDTGVDSGHPALAGAVVGGACFVTTGCSYFDDNGHGTHVSGIITGDASVNAAAQGVAQGAKVFALKVCDASGSCPTSAIAAAIDYVVANKATTGRVISMSLGGGGTGASNCDRDYLAKKVNAAASAGVTSVIAAGNNGKTVSSPGCASKAIAVGAVDDASVRAYFSGKGKALDIMAPGVGIMSSVAGGTYESWSGTSMATPHVSAVIALMLQKNPSITDAAIKSCLYSTATNLGAAGWDSLYGNGLVNAGAAAACA